MGLQQARKAIASGECDAAVVVSANIARFPETLFGFRKLGLITDDSVTRSFDQDGEQ